MCGIAGGINVSRNDLQAMLQSLSHRGPDGSGTYYGEAFQLGMTRLAILDPAQGQQPFFRGHVQAVCNGEIYVRSDSRTIC